MASQSEVGHNKNVANFSAGIIILQEMGPLYNPSNPNLKLPALNPIKTSLAAVITILNDKKPIYKNAVADREVLISSLSKLVTRALNAAKALEISTVDKENLEAMAKKIRGVSKTKKVNPDTADVDTISTSQMSYDSRIANLETFNSQLASHPEYVPNETELQIVNLKAYHLSLKTFSTTVNTAGKALITARKNRNEILYKNPKNVILLVTDIKSYLKSLGSVAEPYYKAFVKLKFKDLQK